LVELHDGTVSAESRGEGQGTSFTVHLPVIGVENIASPISSLKASQNSPVQLDGVSLLVVDDDIDSLELFGDMLKPTGAEIRLARSVASALQIFAELRPNLLISDISMPGEDGYSLIRKLRQLDVDSGGRTPAIALTAYAATDDIRRIIEAGFSAHVAKPVQKAMLLRTIAKLVSGQEGISK
jgi:CheY-like chemotaxis protein